MFDPWKKNYDKPRQHIKRQRHYFANKAYLVKVMVFSSSQVRLWELDHKEDWAPKNWCFQIVVLEKTLKVPWSARKSNQWILRETNTEYSLEGWRWSWSFNTLATWCEEPIHWKGPWCWEKLRARGEGDDRGWGGWMASWTQWTWVRANSGR